MPLINSVTGIAEGVLGSYTEWRKVANNNPSEMFGKLPPTLQADVDNYYKRAKSLVQALDIKGLDIPDAPDINSVMGKLFQDKLGGIFTEADKKKPELDKALEKLKQLDWLL